MHEFLRKIAHPCLLLSMSRGATARMYVQVQMSKRMTSSRDWKLNSADCRGCSHGCGPAISRFITGKTGCLKETDHDVVETRLIKPC
jgi:hypothetical protein